MTQTTQETNRRDSQELEAHPHQAAGHLNILSDHSGHILKPYHATEHHIYSRIKSAPPTSPLSDLAPFIPDFHGDILVNPDIRCRPNISKNKDLVDRYLILEDVTAGFAKPCVMDIKMGVWQYTEAMTDEKRRKSIRKTLESTSHKYGIRICGYQKYDPQQQKYTSLDRSTALALDLPSVLSEFRRFFSYPPESRLLVPHLQYLSKILSDLLTIFSDQSIPMTFVSSSLLIAYDAASSGDIRSKMAPSGHIQPNAPSLGHTRRDTHARPDTTSSGHTRPNATPSGPETTSSGIIRPDIRVKMIDFAQTWEECVPERDEGYILGLKTLIGLCDRLLDEADERREPRVLPHVEL
eukprot:TRINITY_DN1462_c0_g1_i1.p1 TRINITY_DN1462_c0_g1~~TRINITY_DN1462_c0_g1_i1.p1  ORF type:complete len:352 (+),score=60.35 TRINITY_DN1462_c0_g1_i1:58-1113(+)